MKSSGVRRRLLGLYWNQSRTASFVLWLLDVSQTSILCLSGSVDVQVTFLALTLVGLQQVNLRSTEGISDVDGHGTLERSWIHVAQVTSVIQGLWSHRSKLSSLPTDINALGHSRDR